MQARIQLIEDDIALAKIMAMHFEDLGHEVCHATSLNKARKLIQEKEPDLVLLDQGLPDGKGIEFLAELVEADCSATIIMITAEHDLELAIKAIRIGAYDFIHKPVKTDELDHIVQRALENQRLSRQVKVLSSFAEIEERQPRLLGHSQAMLDVGKEIALVAASQARVLITGESGTGKELVARAIHHHSQKPGPFLAINCAAMVSDLLESELFGHEKGAFTGATNRKPGKFELAIDGTLFLDEIGELALPLQAKLLRVLQEGTFERVGGTQLLHSNARIVAATNRDLATEILQDRFREDLFYRLNTMEIHLPPLRERREDVPMLVEGLLEKICRSEGRAPMHVTPEAMAILKSSSWQGNIRELENVLSQAVLRARSNIIDESQIYCADQLSHGVRHEPSRQPLLLAEIEAQHIQFTLDYVEGHKGKACELLGISRPALDRKIEKYGITLS